MMRKIIFAISIAMLFVACKQKTDTPHILIETGFGDIEIELYAKQAPKTVAAFLSYIDSNYYQRCSFYRVLNDDNQPSNAPKTELIQGGIWKTKNKNCFSIKGH